MGVDAGRHRCIRSLELTLGSRTRFESGVDVDVDVDRVTEPMVGSRDPEAMSVVRGAWCMEINLR